MKTRNRVILGGAAALAALLLAVYFRAHGVGERPSAATVAARQPMPTFDLETLDGQRFSSSSFSGKVALVDFWATWCGPCVEEIPTWNELHLRYAPKGFTVLGITVQSGWASDIKSDLKKSKLEIRYPLVIGNEKVAQEFGGVLGFPTTFLVDRPGRLYKKYTGQYPGKRAQIERDIQKLLLEKE